MHIRYPVRRRALDVVVLTAPFDDAAILRRTDRSHSPLALRIDNQWKIWRIGAFVTFVVHALLFGSLAVGSGHRKVLPPLIEGFQAVEHNAEGLELVSALLFVNDHSITTPDDQNASAYQTDEEKQHEPTQETTLVASTGKGSPPQSENADSDENAQARDATGDGADMAMLFGRYMGQIKARIERAWEHPINASDSEFRCTAQIRQTKRGVVQEISLQRCGMDGRWQSSLFKAIQSASPLSAPPSEKVFTEVITLSFTAQMQSASSSDLHEVNRSALTKRVNL